MSDVTKTGRPGSRRAFISSIGALAVVSAVPALSACGPAKAPPTPEIVSVQLHPGLPTAVSAWLVSALTKEADAMGVGLAMLAPADADLADLSAPTSSTGRSRADLLLTSTSRPARLGWQLSLADTHDLAEMLIRRNGSIATRLRAALTSDKKLWAIPFGATGRIWLVRRDLFDAAAVPLPNTMVEARDAAARLARSANGLAGWAVPLAQSAESEAFLASLIVSAGGSLASDDGLKPQLSSSEVVQAIGFAADLVKRVDQRLALPLNRNDWAGDAIDAAFFDGRAALASVSAESYAANRASLAVRMPGAKFEAIPPPMGAKRRATAPRGWVFAIPRAAAHARAGADLLSRVLTPSRLAELGPLTGGAFIPSYADAVHSPYWNSDPVLSAIVQSTRGDSSRQIDAIEAGHPGPISAGSVEVLEELVLSKALERCAESGLPVDESIRQAQAQAIAIYDRVNRDLASRARSQGASSRP